MKKEKKMIVGYLLGGLLVFAAIPYVIYSATRLLDSVYHFEVIGNPVVRILITILLIATGLTYGIWSIIIQNTVGKGGPVEIGNIEISPKTEQLIVTGPYKNTRNPMLFGTFLMYLGFALLLNSLNAIALVCAFIIFMLTIVVRMEEKRLSHDFGRQYEEYRRKVSKFFPWFQHREKK